MRHYGQSNEKMTHLIVNRYQRVMRGESSCRSLPVHEQLLRLAIEIVFLHFGDIVRNVIYDVHVKVVWI